MRRLVPYVAFGLTLFAIGLLILIPLLSCEPTHPSAPARFVYTELRRKRFADHEQVLCRINQENRRLTGVQSRFGEAEPTQKMPSDAIDFGANQY